MCIRDRVVFDQVKVGVILNTEFFQPPKVDRTGASVGTVDLIAFVEQQFGEVGAVLTRDAGDKRGFSHNQTP